MSRSSPSRPPATWLLEVTPPAGLTAGPGGAENMLAALALPQGCALEITYGDGGLRFLARARTEAARAHLARQLHGQYPQCTVRPLDAAEADPACLAPGEVASAIELRLREPAFLPVRTYRDLDARDGNDPLLGILAVLCDLPAGMRGLCQLALWPADPRWARDMGTLVSPQAAQAQRLKAVEAAGGGGSLVPLVILGVLAAAGLQGYLLYQNGDLLHLALLGGAALVVLPLGLWLTLRGPAAPPDPALVREKVAHRGFVARLRLLVTSPGEGTAERAARQAALDRLAAAYGPYDLPGGNAFAARPCATGDIVRPRAAAGFPRPGRRPLPLLNAREAASLWHLPAATSTVPTLQRGGARQLLAAHPALLQAVFDGQEGITLGLSRGQGKGVPLWLPAGHLRRNTLVLGGAGSGKSIYLQTLARGLLATPGYGLVVLDPHSSAAPAILGQVPPARASAAISLCLADTENPIGLNLLDAHAGRTLSQVEESLIVGLKYHWDTSWGARMENVFRYALRTLLEANAARRPAAQYTILDVTLLLTNGPFRMDVLRQVRDRDLHRYWLDVYAGLARTFRDEMIMPVLNKIDRFNQPALRAIVGQSETRLSFAPLLERLAPLIVDTAAATIGADNAGLIGATVIDLLAARMRERGEGAQRVAVLVDEFQQTPVNWAAAVEGMRKYGASFVLATQSLTSLERVQPGLRGAIFGSKGTIICFQTSAEDARYLTYELDEQVEAADLVNLPVRQGYLKTTTGDERLPVCSVEVPLPPAGNAASARRIGALSAARYGRDRAEVEAERQAFLERLYTRPGERDGREGEVRRGDATAVGAAGAQHPGQHSGPSGGSRTRSKNTRRSRGMPQEAAS